VNTTVAIFFLAILVIFYWFIKEVFDGFPFWVICLALYCIMSGRTKIRCCIFFGNLQHFLAFFYSIYHWEHLKQWAQHHEQWAQYKPTVSSASSTPWSTTSIIIKCITVVNNVTMSQTYWRFIEGGPRLLKNPLVREG
jgi:hypothetical protein